MKKTLTLLLICLTFLVNAQTGMLNGSGYAPDITVTDINGNTHNLYNYLDSGKVVVLEFLSVTCGHCQQQTQMDVFLEKIYGFMLIVVFLD